jgi:hypothetical protein
VAEAFRPSSSSGGAGAESPSPPGSTFKRAGESRSPLNLPDLAGPDDADEAPPSDDPSLASIRDPYVPDVALPPPAATQRARFSPLAVASVVSLLIGPIGPVAAILFGWAARRDLERSDAAGGGRGRRAGHLLASIGMTFGVILTMVWGAALSLLIWSNRYRMEEEPVAAAPPPPAMPAPNVPGVAPAPAAPRAASEPQPGSGVPRSTTSRREGKVTLVDLGTSVTSLSDELARQRADAANTGETLVVMTTAARCDPCRGVEEAMPSALMQAALARVRLARVDVDVFREDLDVLKIPHARIPGFFLLAPDLAPRDGIDGGEWDDDIPQNIAPVLGAFVRGKHTTRRREWQPLPGSGIRL